MSSIDEFGGPEAYNHYAVGWAHAMDTPYQWTKQVASHWGGTRNGTIVHWPKGIKAQGRDPLPVPPRHRCRADDPGSGWYAGSRRSSTACSRRRWKASACCMHSTTRRRPSATNPVLRDVLQPRHLSQRLDRGDPALARRGSWRNLPPFDDDVWELYDTNKDWTPGARSGEADAGKAARICNASG